MPPKRRPISNSEVDTESLKTAVFKERVIWDEQDPNHNNSYLIGKSWDNVAASLQLTKKSIMKKWEELRSENQNLLRQEPHLASGSAGGHASRFSDSLHYADQLGFLKDTHTPVVSTAGNLDSLMEKPTAPAVVMKPHEPCHSAGAFISMTGTTKVTDEQFLASLIDATSHLNDEEKLDLRIDIMEELEKRSEGIEFNSDEDEVTCLGAWIPGDKQQ